MDARFLARSSRPCFNLQRPQAGMSGSNLKTLIQPLAAAVTELSNKPPWCTGTLQVSPEDLNIFYLRGNEARMLRIPEATENQLDELAEACRPETFGSNDEAVLDCKAGKMDVKNFSINFTPGGLGLSQAIKSNLPGDKADERNISFELCKLNVYGKGSFFKTHWDTPRDDDMVGSLVIVLPTPHEGGALLLRHDNEEMIFDSGQELKEAPAGTIACAAFSSDVDHEVQQVKSGHRVSLTYNLYFGDSDSGSRNRFPTTTTLAPAMEIFSKSLKRLLDNPKFLPKGGLLGFGLKHQYPISSNADTEMDLQDLIPYLKGEDSAILDACKAQGLEASLKIVYELAMGYKGKYHVMCDELASRLEHEEPLEDAVRTLRDDYGGTVIWQNNVANKWDKRRKETRWDTDVTWITPMKNVTPVKHLYIDEGSHIEMGYAYGYLSIIVEVGAPGRRDDPSVRSYFKFSFSMIILLSSRLLRRRDANDTKMWKKKTKMKKMKGMEMKMKNKRKEIVVLEYSPSPSSNVSNM
ncbi:hypothetical protein BD410DRAFT_781636 [Rickenella mellea]|uniref:Fe2OG dioxygenase domain-containing protein n=1 Tax=Rickenella mellea TaxID=50990 RepID=A0A4Y7QKY8_9AGAM|nr:hypothetical protein BD410DRAFT_781636 [Rickenella mellea]